MSDAPDLACNELVEIVTDYIEGLLPTGERQRFEAHLAECPGCETYLEQMRVATASVGRLSTEAISPAAKADLLHAFREWKRETLSGGTA